VQGASQVKKNSLLSFISSTIRFLTTSLLFIGIGRIYGTEKFGSFTSAYALASLFIILADFGFDLLLTTKVAHEPNKAGTILEELFSLKLIFTALTLLVIWSLPVVKSLSLTTTTLVYILSFTVIFNTLTNYFIALFRGMERFTFEIEISIISSLVLISGLVYVFYYSVSLFTVAILFVVSRGVALLWAARRAISILQLRSFRLTTKGWKYRNQIFTFGFALVFGHLYSSIITPMITLIRGDYDTGIYESAFKILGSVLILADVGVNALLPTLTRYYYQEHDRWLEISRMFTKTLFVISLPIAFVFIVFPGQIIRLIYGANNFEQAIPVMKLAGLVIFIRFSCESFGVMLTSSGRQSIRMRITAIATIVSLVLSLMLIPKLGFIGAAITTILVNMLVGINNAYTVRESIRTWVMEKHYYLAILATMIIGIIVSMFPPAISRIAMLPSTIGLSVILFFISFTQKERKRLLSIREIIR